MAGQPTVLSNGGQVSVPSSGTFTAAAIQQVQGFLNSAGPTREIIWDGTGAAPAAPVGSPPDSNVLEIVNGTNFGTMSIPSGYGAVLIGQGSSGSVTGGDANTTVLSAGSITYSGNAAEVVETSTTPGTTANITDDAAGAKFALGGGSYTLHAAGNGDTIQVDTGAQAAIVAAGNGDTIQLGDPLQAFQSAFAAAASVAGGGGTNLRITGTGDAVTLNGAGNVVGDSGGSTTITGVTGSSTVFAASNDVYFGAAAVTEFISSSGAQTVFGGIGNDTVFNTQGGSTVYNQGSGTNSIFVAAGDGHSTVNGAGAGAGAVFTDGGSTVLNLNSANDQFVGTGGTDSIYGGSVTATVFGGSNEKVTLVGSHAAFEVALGNNTVLDGSLSTGNNFFAISTTGNTTLVGSTNAASVDIFALQSVAGGAAHTVTITNWHSGDGFFLNGYGAADIQAMDTALNGGGSSFHLSDGTTVTFQGAHPMHAMGFAGF